MTISHPVEKKRFSYADYLTWADDQRRELIHGEPVLMSPAPNRSHQTVLKKLGYQIETYTSNWINLRFPKKLKS